MVMFQSTNLALAERILKGLGTFCMSQNELFYKTFMRLSWKPCSVIFPFEVN